jgi:threonyl-tRNA synthetase
LQTKRMELAARLWGAGIKAEFGYKPNPKMGDQLGYALEQGVPLMVLFGEDELARGVVKVKDMAAKTEDAVALDDLVDTLAARVAALPGGLLMAAGGQQQQQQPAAAAASPAAGEAAAAVLQQ